GRNMEPLDLQRDPVEAFVHGNVKSFALVADAEAAVARDTLGVLGARLRDACGNETNFLATRIDHQDAGPLEAAGGEIDVALHIYGHAVGAILLAEIHQRFPLTVDQAVRTKRKAVHLHRSFFRWRLVRVDAIGAVVVLDDIERLLVWAEGDAVRLF